MATSISGEVSSPVLEAGMVRFKLTGNAQAAVTPHTRVGTPDPVGFSMGTGSATSRSDSTGHMATQEQLSAGYTTQISQNVVAGISNSIDAEAIGALIAQPSAQGFANALFGNFNASLTLNDWLTLQAGMDSDFCFFSATVNFSPTSLQTQVGHAVLAATGNLTLAFGPSRAAWLAMGLRLGPQFFAFISRIVPAAAPTTAAVAGETAFSSWIGPIGWAIPNGIAIRDFVVAICDMARERGVARGNYNQIGVAYARHAYSMRSHENPRDDAVIVGRTKAHHDIQRHGVASVRRYLEDHFREGRAVPPAHSQAGLFDHREVDQLGFELGEEMFRSR